MADQISGRGRRGLLASTCVAALLIAAETPSAFAACPTVITGAAVGCTNTAAILGVNIQGAAVTGSIVNTGVISPNGISVNTGSTITGQISDSGTLAGGIVIDHTSQISGASRAVAIAGPTFAGGIANSGTITGSVGAIFISGGDKFLGGISNSGVLSGGFEAVTIDGVTTFGGGITNSGTISSGVAVGILVNAVSSFSGAIRNAGGTILSADTGIVIATVATFGSSSAGGGITNSGTISVGGIGIVVTAVPTFLGGVSNSGMIISGRSAAIDVGGGATFAGGISNSGVLSASGNGIVVNGAATFAGAIRNSGAITASGYGIFVTGVTQFGASAAGGIRNSGAISAGQTGISINASVTTFSGGIRNSGTIKAGAAGIVVGASASLGETVTFTGGIRNTGTISAGGTGILIQNTPGVSFFDSGTLIGGNGKAIQFGAGTNILTLGPGYAITGAVLGAGADTFQLGGKSGSGAFDLSTIGAAQQYQGFATFNEVGGATWTVTGTFGLSNPWTVESGTLVVNGSLASASLTTVDRGGALSGAGTLGDTLILAGGTFQPGSGAAGSSLIVTGALGLAAGSTYVVDVGPTKSSFANVSGVATLGGAKVEADFASVSYISKQYTILDAGSVSGKFGALTNVNLPANFTDKLTYNSGHAYLDLTLNLIAPATPGAIPGAAPLFAPVADNGNQRNAAIALTQYFNTTGAIPTAFATLSPGGLTQASGEAATGIQQTTFRAMDQFVGMLLGEAGAGLAGARADGFANPGAPLFYDDPTLPTHKSGALAALTPQSQPTFTPAWSVWAGSYGGAGATAGNGEVGSNTVTSQTYGVVAGADYRGAPDTVLGFGLGGGGASFGLANALGGGSSNLFQAGFYGIHNIGSAYIGAAAAYGWQEVTTNRTVSLTGGGNLQARFNANTLEARAEAGDRLATPYLGVTPYAALQVTSLLLPSYGESAPSGANAFALNYASQTVTDARTELGARFDKSFATYDALLTLGGRLAWAHDFEPTAAANATFQSLPGASFTVFGATPSPDSALVSAGAEFKWANGFSAQASFEGDFSSNTKSYGGRGALRYTW